MSKKGHLMSAEEVSVDIPSLVMENCEGHYDFATATGTITYSGEITPEMTTRVYQWMGQTLKLLPEGHVVRGAIFDFTGVKETSSTNITTANVRGKRFRTEHAPVVTNIPTALLVQTLYQELLVEMMMKLAKHSRDESESHVRMVKTMDEARAFIDGWHQKNGPTNSD
jgi:hypothetical protein